MIGLQMWTRVSVYMLKRPTKELSIKNEARKEKVVKMRFFFGGWVRGYKWYSCFILDPKVASVLLEFENLRTKASSLVRKTHKRFQRKLKMSEMRGVHERGMLSLIPEGLIFVRFIMDRFMLRKEGRGGCLNLDTSRSTGSQDTKFPSLSLDDLRSAITNR